MEEICRTEAYHRPGHSAIMSSDFSLTEIDRSHLPVIIKEIADALVERHEQIVAARNQKGGWEGWLQVELATALLRPWAMEYDIYREQVIFSGSERIDIWCQPVAKHKGQIPYIGVELKVESEYQAGTGKTFRDRFEKDILKVGAGPASPFRTGAGSLLMAVGVTSLGTDLQDYDKLVKKIGSQIFYCPLVVADPGYDHRNIYLIWWMKRFP
jgi:hypothetical protein